MRVFITKPFGRFIEHEGIDEDILCEAILRAEKGLIDADLGGGVIKQRLARKGQGKSGGFRTIIVFRHEVISFFVYGFAKNAQENISRNELKAFRKLAQEMLALDGVALTKAMRNAQWDDNGDNMPWVSNIAAMLWQPCTRQRWGCMMPASWTSRP